MLAPLSRLTSLHVCVCTRPFFQAAALAGKSNLQHLEIPDIEYEGTEEAGTKAVLSALQHLQELTYLNVKGTLRFGAAGAVPATCYSTLTASSKLRHLEISCCQFPAGVWKHIFPASKQMPCLQVLIVHWIKTGGQRGRS